jgi:hypothetical protein
VSVKEIKVAPTQPVLFFLDERYKRSPRQTGQAAAKRQADGKPASKNMARRPPKQLVAT